MKRYGKNTCKTIVSFIYTSIKSLKKAYCFQAFINLQIVFLYYILLTIAYLTFSQF